MYSFVVFCFRLVCQCVEDRDREREFDRQTLDSGREKGRKKRQHQRKKEKGFYSLTFSSKKN